MGRRTRRTVENGAYIEFVGRILKALAKRVGDGDVGALGELVALRGELDRAIEAAVGTLRSAPYNYSWAQIGAELGTTRQAAQIRYGHVQVVGGRKVGGQPAELR